MCGSSRASVEADRSQGKTVEVKMEARRSQWKQMEEVDGS